MSQRDPIRSDTPIPTPGASPPGPRASNGAASRSGQPITLPELAPAFELASAELGFAAAAWLFVERVAELSGREAVLALREELGASFSVLDFVAARWLAGERAGDVDTSGMRAVLSGVRRVLVVGLEARHLDALVRDLDASIRIGLLTYRLQRVDWSRVVDNYGGRIEPVSLTEFQAWAGSRSAILTFVYGVQDDRMNVLPAFLRVTGSDVRTQFRDVIGWDVLGAAPEVYPRYLVEALTSELTSLVDVD